MRRVPPSLGERALFTTPSSAIFVVILTGIFFGPSASAVEFTLARDIDFIEAEGFGPEGTPVQVGDRVVVTIRYDETQTPVLPDANLAGLFGAFPFLSVELVDAPTVLSGFGGPSAGIVLIDDDPVAGGDEVKDSFSVSLLTSFDASIEGVAFGDTPDSLTVALSSFGPIAGPPPDLIQGLDVAPLPPFDPDELLVRIQYFDDQNEVERSLILQSGGEGIAVPEPSATISLVVALASVLLAAHVAKRRRTRSGLVFDVGIVRD